MVTGTATYRERIALPPDAVAEFTLEDVSRQDVKSVVLAKQTIDPAPPVPISFQLPYDPAAIDPRMSYVVRATIGRGDSLLFVTDRAYPVLSRDHPDSVDLILVRSGGGAAPVANAELVGTRWLLRTLRGEEIQPGEKPPFLQLSAEEDQPLASGSGGCNTFRGGYTVDGAALEFGPAATTMMACLPPAMELEQGFFRILSLVKRSEIRSTWLILSGDDGELATFEAWYE